MVSINSSATLAIRNLQAISKSLTETQNRMTTGYKVNSAKDNPSVWQAATTIRNEMKTYGNLIEDLEGVKSAADVAQIGIDAIADTLSRLKVKVNAYSAATGDSAKQAVIMVDIAAIQKDLITAYGSAELYGSNWLDGTTASVAYSASLSALGVKVNDTFATTDLKTELSVTAAGGAGGAAVTATLTSFLEADIAPAKIATVTDRITAVETIVKTYSAKVTGLSNRLTSQQDLLQKISDIKETALGRLVDADLEEEAAKASALQVKQQLAYQAIQMANASSTNILRLFQ